MCKKITAIYVDSNDKIAGSNSSSDFKITLTPPCRLTEQRGHKCENNDVTIHAPNH